MLVPANSGKNNQSIIQTSAVDRLNHLLEFNKSRHVQLHNSIIKSKIPGTPDSVVAKYLDCPFLLYARKRQNPNEGIWVSVRLDENDKDLVYKNLQHGTVLKRYFYSNVVYATYKSKNEMFLFQLFDGFIAFDLTQLSFCGLSSKDVACPANVTITIGAHQTIPFKLISSSSLRFMSDTQCSLTDQQNGVSMTRHVFGRGEDTIRSDNHDIFGKYEPIHILEE